MSPACACDRARGVLCAWHAFYGDRNTTCVCDPGRIALRCPVHGAESADIVALEAMWRLPARAPEDRQ